MNERSLFILQRISAALLAPLVIAHLVLILVAVNQGLSAEEILGRTRSNYFWGGFYLLFVLSVSVHAPIGLRNILREWTSLHPRWINGGCLLLAVAFLLLGLRAVAAVI
ncbi:MAG: succinate dehydrogenase [Granulosicoccus sp.]|nr:succinate dehydrogenase [Granulosicoccus sp.]